MGALPFCRYGEADENVSRTTDGNAEQDFVRWLTVDFIPRFTLAIQHPEAIVKKKVHIQPTKLAKLSAQEQKQLDDDLNDDYAEYDKTNNYSDDEPEPLENNDDGEEDHEKVVDLEDLGANLKKNENDKKVSSADAKEPFVPRSMLTDQLRTSLSKQGYKLIGTHSGVKLCRWTKAMLRGRGGCYKHTFYGIMSFQVNRYKYILTNIIMLQ
jgi:tRNA wybutosine-synthesizing protein 1